MSPTFHWFLALMGIAAGAVIGLPLWRADRRHLSGMRAALTELKSLRESAAAGAIGATEYASRRASLAERVVTSLESNAPPRLSGGYQIAAVAILLPVCAAAIYSWIRTPSTAGTDARIADSGVENTAATLSDHGLDMRAAVAKLAGNLREHPDDAEGWALLGRTYRAMQQYPEARDAFQHAVAAAPTDTGYQQELGTAMTPAEPPMDSESTNSANPSMPAPHSEATAESRITVDVLLDATLKDKIGPSDTLFVFAKAAKGPAMPLAIARLSAAQLPASVTLSDGMAMMPNLTLSKFPHIVLSARVSKSGNAAAQHGDFEASPVLAANDIDSPVHLIINQTVE